MNKLTGKQQAFIEHYLKNGHNAGAAAKSANYAPNAKNRDNVCYQLGHKLVRNGKVGKIIESKMAELAEKTEFTVQKAQSMYQEAYDLAKKCNQPTAMNGAVQGIARLYGMDKDATSKPHKPPAALTEAEREAFRAFAIKSTKTG